VHALPSHFVPRVCVQISDCKVCALLNSGSTCSVIPFSLYNKLRQLRKVAAHKEFPVTCITATSQPLNIVGQVRCKLRLNRYTWVVPLLVSDNLVCPAILDTDFLAKTGLLMDLTTCLFHFPFDPSNRLRLCTERIFRLSQISIPPGTWMRLMKILFRTLAILVKCKLVLYPSFLKIFLRCLLLSYALLHFLSMIFS
jgi:hypothetical protein